MDLDLSGTSRTPPGRHRRSGPRGDHADRRRSSHVADPASSHIGERIRSLPRPSASALIGVLVLVLIAAGAIHLSTRGTAVPPDDQSLVSDTAPAEAAPTDTASSGPDEAADDPGSTDDDRGDEEDAGADPEDPNARTANEESAGEPSVADTEEAGTQGTARVVVHVSGQVVTPGVVGLPAGARVDDAVRAAGGTTAEADLAAVNLARTVVDGEQVHVPAPGEEPPAVAGPPAAEDGDSGDGRGLGDSGGSGDAGSAGSADAEPSGGVGLIDLNTASIAELEELPGVGPAIGQRIIDHRETNGPFETVEDLLEVSGIGPATLEKIAPMATV